MQVLEVETEKLLSLIVISDSLGELGSSVAHAIRLQFPDLFAATQRFPFVSSTEEIEKILSEAAAQPCLLIYTLVLPETRSYTERRCHELGIVRVDLLGRAIDAATQLTGREPIHEAGLNRRLDDEYFRKVAAVEFAVKYDDGTDPSSLERADIVLVGISRTSKTPLSMYLAYRNYKVANVPLIPGTVPPQELFEINPKKIVGLTNTPERLLSIRSERLRDLGIENSKNYASLEIIKQEIEYANEVFATLACPVIDVANRSIEETAVMIITMMQQQEIESTLEQGG